MGLSKIQVNSTEIVQVDTEPISNSRNLIESNAVSESVYEIINGKSVILPWVALTTNWTENKMIKGNVIQNFNGRAVSDLIDIHYYLERTLCFQHATIFGDSQTIVFYASDGETVVKGHTETNEAEIPNNAYYVRLSTSNNDIANILILIKEVYNEIYGTNQIKALKREIDSIPKSVNWVYGTGFIESGGSSITGDFGIELQPKKYNKLKYQGLSSFNHSLYGYVQNLGYYIIVAQISLSGLTNDGKVHEVDIDLDLRDYDRVLYLGVKGEKYQQGSGVHQGRKFYNNIANIIGSPNADNISVWSENICLNIDFEYDSYGESESPTYVINNIKVSKFFEKKKYVAYGDSITYGTVDDYDGGPNSPYAYPALIAAHFGFNLINRGANGSSPISSSNLSDANLAYVDENTMLVTISGGANGWTTSEDINTLDRTTSIGAINYYIDQIRLISPKCVIVLCPTYYLIANAAEDYQRIADNKKVGLAPTRDFNLINWEYDPAHVLLRPDGIHNTNYGSLRFAAVCISYLEQMIM